MSHTTKKVIAAIIQKDNKVLIAQRAKKDSFYKKWEFPGGKMEQGETEQQCLQRELFEEFGVHAHIGSYFCSSFFEYKQQPMELRAYFVLSVVGEFELYDHLAIQWVELEQLPFFDMPDPDKPIVQALLEHKV